MRLPSLIALLLLVPATGWAQRYVLEPGSSQASYAVDEVFLRENNRLFTAIAISKAVSGEILLDRKSPGKTQIREIAVDLRELTSDSERRDRALREKYLDTRRFPFATLNNIELRGVSEITEGRRFKFLLLADLTVHGTTRRTTWSGEAELRGDVLQGEARTNVKMSAFGIEVPNLLSLRAEDDVIITIRFHARNSEEP